MSPFRKALPLLSLLAAAFCGSLAAQTPTTPADCIVPASGSASFTAATTGTAYSNSNSFTPCAAWRVTYNSTGFSALSIQIETSPDNSSWTAVPNTVCSSSVQPPCVIDGANPTTTTTNATFAVRAYGRYVRLNVTSVTGTGTISTKMYGYKGLSASAGQGGSGPAGPAGPAGPTGPTGPTGPSLNPLIMAFSGGGAVITQTASVCRTVEVAQTITGGTLVSYNSADPPVATTSTVTIKLYYWADLATWNAGTAGTAMKGSGADPALSSAKSSTVSVTNWAVTSLAAQSIVCAYETGAAGDSQNYTLTLK